MWSLIYIICNVSEKAQLLNILKILEPIWNEISYIFQACRLVKISSRHHDDKGLKTGRHGRNLVVTI